MSAEVHPLPPISERPLVSIIVPSYNQGRFIRRTIESCLAQDYRPLEIIVIDGASTDETVPVLQSFGDVPGLSWVSESDQGVVDAVNKGFRRSRGSICAIQSSDDSYLTGAVSQAVAVLERNPQACLVYGDTIKVDDEGREISRFRTGSFSVTNFLSKRTVILQPATFFRRDDFDAAGGWSAEYFNADTECWMRMIMCKPAVKVDTFWALRSMHSGQRDKQAGRILESYTRMMRNNPSLRVGPLRWRLAAQCGVLRHGLRYRGDLSPRAKKRLLLRAALRWPPTLMDAEVGGLLLPGYFRLRRWLSTGGTPT